MNPKKTRVLSLHYLRKTMEDLVLDRKFPYPSSILDLPGGPVRMRKANELSGTLGSLRRISPLIIRGDAFKRDGPPS